MQRGDSGRGEISPPGIGQILPNIRCWRSIKSRRLFFGRHAHLLAEQVTAGQDASICADRSSWHVVNSRTASPVHARWVRTVGVYGNGAGRSHGVPYRAGIVLRRLDLDPHLHSENPRQLPGLGGSRPEILRPASTALNRRKEGVDDMDYATRLLGRTCSTPPRGQRRGASLPCRRGDCGVPVCRALVRTSLGRYD